MGAGASVAADSEVQRPTDASDIIEKTGATSAEIAAATVAEVVRLRRLMASSLLELPDNWFRAYDELSGAIYFYSEESGEVRWNPPNANATPNKENANEAPPSAPPTPTANALAHAHHAFQSKLAKATRTVLRQLRRQHLIWEHNWHTELLNYVAELRAQVGEMREDDIKKLDYVTKTAEDRAAIAEEEAEEAANEVAALNNKNKEDRHQKLMAKLAKRKRAAALKRAEKTASQKELINRLKKSFSDKVSNHMKKMKTASEFLKNAEGGVTQDKTMGWVQLFDDSSGQVYYWHPDHGSTWNRPEEMEFNLNLSGIWSQEDIETLSSSIEFSETSKHALESWFAEHQISAEELEDEALEAEIVALEDELERRRSKFHHPKDLELYNSAKSAEEESADSESTQVKPKE